MDKKRLNNEIILCRPAVRKAKVAVIRKLLKRMKILKSCKIEAVKERKLKKSERLFKRVQMMKKIKDDEVTKFALRHGSKETFLKEPQTNLRQIALSYLANHQAVMQRINSIREQVQDWETELPILLDSLGKKKKKVVNKEETTNSSFKTTTSSTKSIKKTVKGGQVKDNASPGEFKVRNSGKAAKPDKQSSRTKSDDQGSDEENDKLETIKKIEDPFFVGKKIVAPKLILESASDKKNCDKLGKLDFHMSKRENGASTFHSKPFNGKGKSKEFRALKPSQGAETEKLHPSWAAKKMKLIKPFQGKKITFSDD